MKKTICDICGKEIPAIQCCDELSIHISSRGVTWDICSECRADFKEWVDTRRTERDMEILDLGNGLYAIKEVK